MSFEIIYNNPYVPRNGVAGQLLSRRTFFHVVLPAILLLALMAPRAAFASKAMFIEATLNPTQTQQGLSVVIAGKVSDASGAAVSNAVVSIQVTNPRATNIHLAIAYSATDGTFQDSFLIPLNSLGGNYTAYVVADKPGYDTARVTLTFNYSAPDFSLQPLTGGLSLHQGERGKFTLTLFSIRGFNGPVNLTALNLPPGVTLLFEPASVTPTGNTEVTVSVSQSAALGNFTVTLLGVSGTTIRTAPFYILITPGPIRTFYVVLPVAVAVLVVLAVTVDRRRRRSQKRAAVEELLRASEADTGYVATARLVARLEELRATNQVDESTYRRLRRDYERQLEKSK